MLALIALRNINSILAKNTAIVRNNFAILETFLAKWAHLFQWTPPRAGCCGFVRYKGGTSAEAGGGGGGSSSSSSSSNNNAVADFMPLALTLVEQHGVLTLPGQFFPCDPLGDGPYVDHFRVGFGRKNFPEVLEKFDAALTASEGGAAAAAEKPAKKQRIA